MRGGAVILKRDEAQPLRIKLARLYLIQFIPTWSGAVAAPMDIEQVGRFDAECGKVTARNGLAESPRLCNELSQAIEKNRLGLLHVKCLDIGSRFELVTGDASKKTEGNRNRFRPTCAGRCASSSKSIASLSRNTSVAMSTARSKG